MTGLLRYRWRIALWLVVPVLIVVAAAWAMSRPDYPRMDVHPDGVPLEGG